MFINTFEFGLLIILSIIKPVPIDKLSLRIWKYDTTLEFEIKKNYLSKS